jgi:hypothetical protein
MRNFLPYLRWFSVLPAAILAMLIARYLAELFAKFVDYEMVEAIELTDGLGGYWTKGAFYIFARQGVMMSAFILAGVAVAPSRHNNVCIVLASILGVIILSSLVVGFFVAYEQGGIRGEFIARNAIYLFGSGVGIAQATSSIYTGSSSKSIS